MNELNHKDTKSQRKTERMVTSFRAVNLQSVSVLCAFVSLWFMPLPAVAALLTGQGVTILDQTGAPRTTFSTNEKIGFTQVVNNAVASPNRMFFSFSVVAPNMNIVFRHVGNSVGGTVGNAASSVAGLAISGFAQGPGLYTLNATASLDGIPLVQTQTFTISSPNILLIYPPNGSSNLSDNPLTFQWYSSGAVTYRVTVGDNPSLYNAIFVQTTAAGVNSLTYPQNPSDPRQRLSSAQTYWWKVEGLDSNANVVATSQVPFSFSVSNTALTRDLAVTELEITGPMDSAGNIPFRVTVKNQGNTTESNTPLRVTLGGLAAPNTPITVPQLSPADALSFNVTASIPAGMNEGLAIACLNIFDDTVTNNCKTVSVTRPTAISSMSYTPDCASVGGEQIWLAIRQILRDRGIDLAGYTFTGMDGVLTCAELSALLDQLRQGQARASLSGPRLLPVILPTPAPVTSAAPNKAGAGPPAALLDAAEQPKTVVNEKTWSGVTTPLAKLAAALVIKNESNWKRLWQRLSDEPVPLIDFSEHMVVAVMAGSADGPSRIQIDDMKSQGSALTVRYQVISYAQPFAAKTAPSAPEVKPTPYLLVAIPRTSLKVNFVRIKESSDDKK